MSLKLKKLDAGKYAVEGTDLRIEIGDPPKYRQSQEWHVMRYGPDDGEWGHFLFTTYGKAQALGIIETIRA